MNKQICLSSLIFVLISVICVKDLSAQDSNPGSQPDKINRYMAAPADPALKIVLNMEMIKRFNSIESADSLYSWSQLLTGMDNRTVQDFFHAYRTSNLEVQSLADIKRDLENNQGETEMMENNRDDAYYAAIAQMKREINQKLSSANQHLVQR